MSMGRYAHMEPLTAAQAQMVADNLGLVWRHANKRPEFFREDVFQDGVFGLMRAAQKYDESKGFTFATYADSWIRQAISVGSMLAEGANYRAALRNGDTYAKPVVLSVQLHGFEGGLDRDLVDAIVGSDDSDWLDSFTQAEIRALVADLTLEERQLLGWTSAMYVQTHGVNHQTFFNRRDALRKRLRERVEGLVA